MKNKLWAGNRGVGVQLDDVGRGAGGVDGLELLLSLEDMEGGGWC